MDSISIGQGYQGKYSQEHQICGHIGKASTIVSPGYNRCPERVSGAGNYGGGDFKGWSLIVVSEAAEIMKHYMCSFVVSLTEMLE